MINYKKQHGKDAVRRSPKGVARTPRQQSERVRDFEQ